MHGKELRLPTVKSYYVKSCSLAAPLVVACICSVVSASNLYKILRCHSNVNGDIFICVTTSTHCLTFTTHNFTVLVRSHSSHQCLFQQQAAVFKTSDKPTVLYQPSTEWQTDKAIATSW